MRLGAALWGMAAALAVLHVAPAAGEQYVSELRRVEFESSLIVRIGCPLHDPKQPSGMQISGGTGVAIGPRLLLTAKHAVTCDNKKDMPSVIGVRDRFGNILHMRVLKLSATRDIALLEVDPTEKSQFKTWAVVQAEPLPTGALACSVAGTYSALKCGYVSGVSPDGLSIALAFRSVLGNSGSPLYDEAGHLRAIVVGKTADDDEHLTMAVFLDPALLGGK